MNSSINHEYYGITDNKISIYKQYENVPIEIGGGTLVQVTHVKGDQISIKIFSMQGGTLLWSTDWYSTAKSGVIPISMKLFEVLLAVKQSDMRSRIMKNGKGFTGFLLGIRVGSRVTLRGSVLNRNYDLPCVIRYIGCVPEIGPGCFFGFEFCDPNEKMFNRNNLPSRYFKCDISRSFIRAADAFLNVMPHDNAKNNNNNGASGMDARRFQNTSEIPKEVTNNGQPSSSNSIPNNNNKRKPKANDGNKKANESVEPEKDSEIEDLRKKIELLELQLKAKALKDKLTSEDATVPSEAKVFHRKKPQRNNKEYGRSKKQDWNKKKNIDATSSTCEAEAAPGLHLRNSESKPLSLSQLDLSYFEKMSSATPPLLKPINIFDNKEEQCTSQDSTGYRELIDFLN